jgi:hypothetical protein
MSTDIVERLRDLSDNLWNVEYRIHVDEDAKTILEAADEIARLRAALVEYDKLRDELDRATRARGQRVDRLI